VSEVKLMFCLRRRADLTRAEFQEYWQGRHGALGIELQSDLGYVRYVQSHTLDEPINDDLQASRGGPPAFDGVVELTFPSLEAVHATFRTEGGRAAARRLLEDEHHFVDIGESAIFVVHEHRMV
jgi:uncharacterized protein (TIGR02118 family)